MSLQRVFCESDFRCEPELLGESYHGVCVGKLIDHFYSIIILLSVIALGSGQVIGFYSCLPSSETQFVTRVIKIKGRPGKIVPRLE